MKNFLQISILYSIYYTIHVESATYLERYGRAGLMMCNNDRLKITNDPLPLNVYRKNLNFVTPYDHEKFLDRSDWGKYTNVLIILDKHLFSAHCIYDVNPPPPRIQQLLTAITVDIPTTLTPKRLTWSNQPPLTSELDIDIDQTQLRSDVLKLITTEAFQSNEEWDKYISEFFSSNKKSHFGYGVDVKPSLHYNGEDVYIKFIKLRNAYDNKSHQMEIKMKRQEAKKLLSVTAATEKITTNFIEAVPYSQKQLYYRQLASIIWNGIAIMRIEIKWARLDDYPSVSAPKQELSTIDIFRYLLHEIMLSHPSIFPRKDVDIIIHYIDELLAFFVTVEKNKGHPHRFERLFKEMSNGDVVDQSRA